MTDTMGVEQIRRNKIHPKKFAMLIGCASMTMLFIALTSAYMVRQAAGNWLEFPLPNIFYVSTAVIVLSSVTLHSSYTAFKRGREGMYKVLLLISLALGVTFVGVQYLGWQALMEMGIPLKLNPSGDFIYAVSGIHLGHIVGGLVALIIATIVAFSRPFKVTPARTLRFEMTLIYWHFVDGIWVYMMIFWLATR